MSRSNLDSEEAMDPHLVRLNVPCSTCLAIERDVTRLSLRVFSGGEAEYVFKCQRCGNWTAQRVSSELRRGLIEAGVKPQYYGPEVPPEALEKHFDRPMTAAEVDATLARFVDEYFRQGRLIVKILIDELEYRR